MVILVGDHEKQHTYDTLGGTEYGIRHHITTLNQRFWAPDVNIVVQEWNTNDRSKWPVKHTRGWSGGARRNIKGLGRYLDGISFARGVQVVRAPVHGRRFECLYEPFAGSSAITIAAASADLENE